MKDADAGASFEGAKSAHEKPEVSRKAPPRFSPLIWFTVIAVITVVIDQVTKFLAENTLEQYERIDLLGDLLGLRLVYNSGAAFSFGSGATWILSLLATVVAIVIIRIAPRVSSWAWVWALSLLLGGAIGNLIDRFFKDPGFPQGHVVDFIDYGVFVGNVADIAIVFAAIFMVYLGVRGKEIQATAPGVSDSVE